MLSVVLWILRQKILFSFRWIVKKHILNFKTGKQQQNIFFFFINNLMVKCQSKWINRPQWRKRNKIFSNVVANFIYRSRKRFNKHNLKRNICEHYVITNATHHSTLDFLNIDYKANWKKIPSEICVSTEIKKKLKKHSWVRSFDADASFVWWF